MEDLIQMRFRIFAQNFCPGCLDTPEIGHGDLPRRSNADRSRGTGSVWGGEKLGLTTVSMAPVPTGFCCAVRRRLLCAGLMTPHRCLTGGLLPSELTQ